MKKELSIISCLIAMLLVPNTVYAAESDDPDLYKLASSLGADTDYLAVANYKRDDEHPLNNDCYVDYMHSCTVLELQNRVNDFGGAISDGSCLGISILEVLTHNGVIAPSDIQEGAETLSEIKYNTASDRYITDYQAMQMHTEFGNYERYFTLSKSYDEKVDILMETAEKCMKEGKYFLIIIQDEHFSHAVCGIGITDGNWTFNDITYDKCVLLLDSNIINKEGVPKGFSNNSCIYINSVTKQSYIPSYDKNSNDIPSLSYVPFSDDTLLNYRGFLNSSKVLKTDTSKIKKLHYKDTNCITITPIDENGNEVLLPEDSFLGSWGTIYKFFESDSVHIELQDEDDSQFIDYSDIDRLVSLSLYHNKRDNSDFNCSIDFSDNKFVLDNNDNNPTGVSLDISMNIGSFNFEPYYRWNILGTVADDLMVEVRDKGMLFKTNSGIDLAIAPYFYTFGEDGFLQSISMSAYYPDLKALYLCTNNNVLISIDDNKKINYFIDANCDDVYDTPVQTGDINCDGKLNSSDASQVLSIYSYLSTSKQPACKTDYSLSDYNGDGHVNSIDASDILAEYGRLSTS